MALYVPAGRRRRRNLLTAAAALVLGLAGGAGIGRASAPSVSAEVSAVRADARSTAAGLRVLALHDQAGLTASAGDGGADLVLRRTRTQLLDEARRSPWLRGSERDGLLAALDALQAMPDRAAPAFGAGAEALAARIEATFGS